MATSIVTLALLGYQFWLLHQRCRREAALQLSPLTLTTSKCFQEQATPLLAVCGSPGAGTRRALSLG